MDDNIIRKGKECDMVRRSSAKGDIIISTTIWLLVGLVAIVLAVALIVAVVAFLVAAMGDDRDWRE